ncbi:MAG: hypothetical protein JNM65_08605 [Verrucomicrobiaceae bacterium]|nr:hypothetical protein [Verrucomicrobiaceae bacterium]
MRRTRPCSKPTRRAIFTLARPDFLSLEVLLYRFLAAEAHRVPHITRVPKAGAGKHVMTPHEGRGEICSFPITVR